MECDGACAAWIHCRCAGLTIAAFKSVCESEEPFYCPHCTLDKQSLEISSLCNLVTSLLSEVSTLTAKVTSLTSLTTLPDAQPSSYGSVVKDMQSSEQSSGNEYTQNQNQRLASQNLAASKHRSDERRYINLVVTGIQECENGTKRTERQLHDLKKVSSIFATLVESISAESIRDVHRLGKYNANKERPRPLLVKMTHSSDVSAVLLRKSALDTNIQIRRDLPKDIRSSKTALLRERRHLIDSGTSRNEIKIRKNKPFVNNVLHGA